MIKHREMTAALLSGILIGIAWMLEKVHLPTAAVLYVVAFVIGGYAQAKEGIQTLIEDKDIDVNLLMIVAAIGAASIGYWTEGAILIFIFSMSGALESYTMSRSHRDISALMELKPETAVLYENGIETVVKIEQLQVGDTVIVRPGERIPADGEVVEGASAVNQSSITGESIPVDKNVNDEVFAGTLNGQGALFVKVTQSSESTLFAKVIRLVQEAKSEKPASQLFVERFERLYARAIIIATVLLIGLAPWLLGWSWNDTFYKAMVFLVVASPCALVASIMPAMLSAISNSARGGLLFKGGAHVENVGQSKVVAFDKTGTLTFGRPFVTDLIAYRGMNQQELLTVAASIESLSEHPLARAIVQYAKDREVELARPESFEALTGMGIVAKLAGETWTLGKPSLVELEYWTKAMAADVERLEEEGKTVTVMYNAEGVAGLIALRDSIRPQAKRAVAQLKQLGIEVAMLTGDREVTAAAIAREAGIELVYAELMPEDKLKRVQELKAAYGSVTMVGDGVNDAPALATATVGIAMGGVGSDAALETADLVLMNDDIERIPYVISLGRRTRRIVLQNLFFSITVILLLITANFVQGVSLPLGVVGHEGSTILVILNGLRLLHSKEQRPYHHRPSPPRVAQRSETVR